MLGISEPCYCCVSECCQLMFFSYSWLISYGMFLFQISIYAVHHLPEYWPSPFLFNPDRWESEADQNPG